MLKSKVRRHDMDVVKRGVTYFSWLIKYACSTSTRFQWKQRYAYSTVSAASSKRECNLL